MDNDFKQKFYDITVLVQQEFDRNLELYGDKIQCRKGCSKCCSQIFRITKLDAYIIAEHIRSLPAAQREALKDKARVYLKHLTLTSGDIDRVISSDHPHTSSDHPGSSSHPSLKKEGNILYCPALGIEGECTIYEARPVICRRFGMPVYDYKNPKKVHACELNFNDGDELTDTMLVPNQTFIGMKWDELKDEFNNYLPLQGGDLEGVEGTTIAEAIAGA